MKKSSIILGLMMMLTINGCGKAKQEETATVVESEVETAQESASKETQLEIEESLSKGNNVINENAKENIGEEIDDQENQTMRQAWELCTTENYVNYSLPFPVNLRVSNIVDDKIDIWFTLENYFPNPETNGETQIGVDAMVRCVGTIKDDKVYFDFVDTQGNKGYGILELIDIDGEPAPKIKVTNVVTEPNAEAEHGVSIEIECVLYMWEHFDAPGYDIELKKDQ